MIEVLSIIWIAPSCAAVMAFISFVHSGPHPECDTPPQ
ncbi:hypothetical protein USDA257_c27010 [Sinorhizobium fredii USDA 257]|uniref:Uncharacterized protein n=1 Tax=Sinorhizobium fredii (strain USDA 257) TaxID=1185652 RepID=I3X5W9_SINF2|nr:hypothetical protein USDA257_c27010 [Sinorhizobium fredii USDA 257]